MITEVISALKAEQLQGASHAKEVAERMDNIIEAAQRLMNDAATIKAWVLDEAVARGVALDALIGGDRPVPVPAQAKTVAPETGDGTDHN